MNTAAFDRSSALAANIKAHGPAIGISMTELPAFDLQALIAANALFVISNSGGKDSQAMAIVLEQLGIPKRQMVHVHADLGAMEWAGTLAHAKAIADKAGLPFLVAKAINLQGEEFDLLDKVEAKAQAKPGQPAWPSQKRRWCTSDLKRGPIAREVRRYAKAHGFTLIVDCQGLRAQESDDRAAELPWSFSDRKDDHAAGRTWYRWLPVHELTTAQVFATIAKAGQQPHKAYGLGNERLSCMYCIMGSDTDLANAYRHNPELGDRYMAIEKATGFNMHVNMRPMGELIAEGERKLQARERQAA